MIQTSLWQEPVGGIIPREYQVEDVASSFRLWDSGTVGVLTRMATGMGKTISSCLKFRRWLDAGDNYRCMVLSYERELVQQFAEEVLDVLGGVSVGIEMGAMEIDPDNIPQIVVASRQTLMTHELATVEQREVLKEFGLSDVKLLTKRAATSAIIDLRKGIDLQTIADGIDEFNSSNRCNHELGRVSRLYKFDNKLNWLLVMDEAHKYSMQLKTVGHIIEWFEQNPLHRRSGITATPKRRDKVSIGTKLFPGISIDYPLTRAVEQGYAVPYIQKFVQVDSVDFKAIKEIAGKSQEKWDNEVNRRIEQDLAKLCDPLLDMVGDRRTLIFSPSVELAGKVCEYINARSECECSCGTKSWHPRLRIGDGAKCHQCGEWLESKHITKDGIQAYSLHGGVPHRDRKSVYEGHKEGKFQFLSVCGLCLDGDSLILTDRGEVPLKEVTRQMKLWDGIEFVSHDGVIFKGSKPVITYAGLTATGDHNVWTDTGWQSFSSCKQRRVEIRVGGIEGMPVRESDRYYRGSGPCRQVNESWFRNSLRRVRSCQHQGCFGDETRKRWLQIVLKVVWCSKLASDALSLCQEALRKSKRSILQGLRCAWDSVSFRYACTYGEMGYGKLGFASGDDARQEEQFSTLRARQSTVGISIDASQQSSSAPSWLQEEPERDEKITEVYDILNAGPRNRFTANGLIVSNCREGYNDPNISCVAVFRPVSKEASSLAEQMKGRGARPLKGIIHGLGTAQERLDAIAASAKPDCLIVDLVGITGLSDCASTVQIYADGLDDSIVARAEEIALEGGVNPIEAINQAQREDKEEKERKRLAAIQAEELRRQRAEERARLDAKANYTTHDVGTSSRDPSQASDKMIKFLSFMGMEFRGDWEPSRAQASRMIGMLQKGDTPDHVAYASGLNEDEWRQSKPSIKQLRKLQSLGHHSEPGMTPKEASDIIDALINRRPVPKSPRQFLRDIHSAATHEELTAIGRSMNQAVKSGKIDSSMFEKLVEAGKIRRKELGE